MTAAQEKRVQRACARLVDRDVLLRQNMTIEILQLAIPEFWEEVSNLDETKEIYEWWAVTDWLAKNLESRGEAIWDGPDCKIWGRCTTGQAILLDDVIRQLVREIGWA